MRRKVEVEQTRPMLRASLLVLALLVSSACQPQPETSMTEPTANLQLLAFECRHENDLLPAPDAEADEWYHQANKLYKVGIDKRLPASLGDSVALLKRAAERGHVKAMNNLVLAYLRGEGVNQSDGEAVAWAERLVKMNIGMGYYHMGVFLQQGIGVHADRKAALTYFRKAADLGNAQGQLVVGDKIARAVVQTPQKDAGFVIARAMMQCALDQGLGEAGHTLGMHYKIFEGKGLEAASAHQAAARLGHRQSLWSLHMLFDKGAPSLDPDPARAACYERLFDESAEDKTRRFPDLDKICPLPPQAMPKKP